MLSGALSGSSSESETIACGRPATSNERLCPDRSYSSNCCRLVVVAEAEVVPVLAEGFALKTLGSFVLAVTLVMVLVSHA